jgi:hypothetical protein
VTVQSFKEWKIIFDREVHLRKMRDDEEKLKAMTTKEREEYKKIGARLTGRRVSPFRLSLPILRFPGRQLFERDKNLAVSDASLLEDGTVSVDVRQYERTAPVEDDEEDRLEFSDSD